MSLEQWVYVHLVLLYTLPTYLRIWLQFKLAALTFKVSMVISNSWLLRLAFSMRIWSRARQKEVDAYLLAKINQVNHQETTMFKIAKVKSHETYYFQQQDDLPDAEKGCIIYRNLSPEEEARFQDSSMDMGFDGNGRKARMVVKKTRMNESSLHRLMLQIESVKNVGIEDDDGRVTPYVWNGSNRETALTSWAQLPKELREEISAAINNGGTLPKDFGKKDDEEDDDATEEAETSETT